MALGPRRAVRSPRVNPAQLEQLNVELERRVAERTAELEASASRGQRGAPGPADEQTPPLPIAQSSFVGRERERAAISELLTRSRLISLIGQGEVRSERFGHARDVSPSMVRDQGPYAANERRYA